MSKAWCIVDERGHQISDVVYTDEAKAGEALEREKETRKRQEELLSLSKTKVEVTWLEGHREFWIFQRYMGIKILLGRALKEIKVL